MRASARTGDKIGLFRHVHCAGVAGPGEALLILDKVEIRGDDDRTLAEASIGFVYWRISVRAQFRKGEMYRDFEGLS